MGTNQGDIAMQSPTAIQPQPSLPPEKLVVDPPRPKSLKRTREPTPSSPSGNDHPGHPQSGSESPSKSARLAGHASRRSQSPPRLTVASDEGRWAQGDSTTRDALETELASTIMASSSTTARQHSNASASAITTAPAPESQPQQAQQFEQTQRSPAVPTAIMATPADLSKPEPSPESDTNIPGVSGSIHVATSPEAMDVDTQSNRPTYASPQPHTEHQPSSSVPHGAVSASAASAMVTTAAAAPNAPSMAAANNHPVTPRMPQRTVTHPISASQDTTPRSPSSTNKKHKCPFCDTEFTRHHNLKSHLLTHSQEKPYECSTCQMRFRRLHDLKRHSKLHTGEKPHICPKCDRKFARGDALARHSKGAGGCAGRRHSLPFDGESSHFEGQGSAEGDEGSAMSGIQYEGAANDGDMTAAHSRTYPPVGARSSGLYPPNTDRSTGNSGGHPSNLGSSHAAIASASLFAQNAMTESPKPLSPHSGGGGGGGGVATTSHAPTATAQTNQASGTQNLGNRRTSDGLSVSITHAGTPGQSSKTSGFGGPIGSEGRYGVPAITGGTGSRTSSGLSAENGATVSSEQVWSYMASLEKMVKNLSDKIDALEKEKTAQISQLSGDLFALRQQFTETRQGEGLPTVPSVGAAPIPPKE